MKKILLISAFAICGVLIVAGYAAASTTISTNINTAGSLTVGADAAGTDVLFYTDTAGEELLWDASENMLTIDGANGANALQVTDGNVAFTDDLAVTGNTALTGTLDVTGITTLTGNLNINGYATTTAASGNFATEGTLTVSTDGVGKDVIFYSGTAGDNFTWDASEEVLNLTGTNGQTALNVADGNVAITDDLAVTGNTALTGTLGVTGATTLIGDLYVNGYATTTAASGNFATEGTIVSTKTTNIGWSVVAGADTACNTTCTNACVLGFDEGAADAETIVDCADTTADKCLCAGAN